MNIEIEHKYLLRNDSYRNMAKKSYHIVQGYLSREKQRTIRIRIKDRTAFLTIKTCATGHIVPFGGFVWEIDEFKGALEGVTLAEIELPSSDTDYPLPPFIGKNVTGDPRYYNSNIHLLAGGKSPEL